MSFLNAGQTIDGADVLVFGEREIVLEQACTYKTLEAARAVGRVLASLDMDQILGQLGMVSSPEAQAAGGFANPAIQALIAQKVIPMVIDDAPDALVRLAALMITPNEELKMAHRKGNGIKKLVDTNAEWLMFDAPASAAVEIVVAYVPYLGLNDLKDSLSPLLDRLSGLVSTEEVEKVEEGEAVVMDEVQDSETT